jgi:Family of unknown function (DUF6334)
MVINEFPIGQTLLGVSTQEDQEFDSDELCLDQVKLYFEDTEHKITWITLSPIVDTDEIDVKIEKNTKKPTKKNPHFHADSNIGNNQLLSSLRLGTKLMAVWICENDQGYKDQVILAFESLQPNIAFVAEGSVIKAFLNQQILKDKKREEAQREAERKFRFQMMSEVILGKIKENPEFINFLTPAFINYCTGIPEDEIQPELISRIKDNPELIRSLTPEIIKSFTGIPKDENSFQGAKIEPFIQNQQLSQIITKPVSNAVISVEESYQKLANRVKELEERILNQESKILGIEAFTSKMKLSDNGNTLTMMQLAETGFQEWNDPEEDIYNDEA